MQYSVDVILPTYKPDGETLEMIERLERQTYSIGKIIIINTEEKYFEELFYGERFYGRFPNVEVHHISKREFDHAGTRKRAVEKYSKAEIFVCMTQDALPADERLIEELVSALKSKDGIAVAYAKQLARDDCRKIERFTRKFNYPDESCVKSKEDMKRLGIKTFFCSNVCAAYDRRMYNEVGGFEKRAIFNEDMIYAGHAVNAGKSIAYAAKAMVIHSHNFTCMQQFHRNFDLGVSQRDHPEVFEGVSSESEGTRLVVDTAKHLKDTGHMKLIPYLIAQSGFKLIGYRLGKAYKRLPKWLQVKCSANKDYFR